MAITITRKVSVSGGTVLRAANNLGDVGSFASARANLGVYSQAEVAAQRNALAPAQALSGNGTAGSTATLTSALGTGATTFSVRFLCPTTTPSIVSGILCVGDFATQDSLQISLSASDRLQFVMQGAGGANYSAYYISAFTATYGGQTVDVVFTRSGTTIAGYVNGNVVALTEVTSATPLAWDTAITSTAVLLGKLTASNYYFTGPIRLLGIANRALSAAEVLAVYQTGSFPTSDFGAIGAPAGTTVTAGAFVAGKKYRIASVGTTSFTGVGASANTVGVEFTATGVGSGTGTAVAIGLFVAPDPAQPGNGLAWGDRSGNGAHILLPTSGVDWLLPSAAVNKLRGTTSTSGNQQLLGGTTLNANTQITRVRARSRSGTPSITLGTAPGESQIVASVALSTTWKDLTIALTGGIISTASSVWVGSSAGDVVEIDLTHEPLGY